MCENPLFGKIELGRRNQQNYCSAELYRLAGRVNTHWANYESRIPLIGESLGK